MPILNLASQVPSEAPALPPSDRAHRHRVSAGLIQFSRRPTLTKYDAAVDGRFVFQGDVDLAFQIEPVDLFEAHQRWTGDGDSRLESLDPGEAKFLTLVAKTQDPQAFDRTLLMVYLPFSMGWELQAQVKRPSGRSNASKAALLEKANRQGMDLGEFLDNETEDLLLARNPRTKERAARLRVPQGRIGALFTGKAGTGAPRALFGLAPNDLEGATAELIASSERLRLLTDLALAGRLGHVFKSGYLRHLHEDAEAMIQTALWAAVRRAFAGPDAIERGPGADGQGWGNQPVSRLAGWYFMQILRTFNRRMLNQLEKEQKKEQKAETFGLRGDESARDEAVQVSQERVTQEVVRSMIEDEIWMQLEEGESFHVDRVLDLCSGLGSDGARSATWIGTVLKGLAEEDDDVGRRAKKALRAMAKHKS